MTLSATEVAEGHRDQVLVSGVRVSFRRKSGAAEFPLLAVFHQTPLSGWTHLPLLHHSRYPGELLIFDTPGYGESSPPPDGAGLEEYVQLLWQALDSIRGGRQLLLLGQHTGAHLAMLIAATHPEVTVGVIFHGLSLYTSAERNQHRRDYAPTIESAPDGSHLAAIWARLAKLYPTVSLELRNRMVCDYLTAEPDYAHAYRAVFDFDVDDAVTDFGASAIPSTITIGTADLVYDRQDRVVRAFGSTVREMPGLTDFAPWEDPEAFAGAVDDAVTELLESTSEGHPQWSR